MAISTLRLSVALILLSAVQLAAQPGNLIWGTWSGGALNNGTILNYNTGTNIVKKEFDFYRTHIGSEPFGGALTVGPDSMIYGTTSTGTFRERGNIFKYNPYDSVYTEIYEFKNTDAVEGPCNDLFIDSAFVIYRTSSGGGGNGSFYKYDLNTNLLTILHQFNGLDGLNPESGMIKASNGLFYGVTNGGAAKWGVIYSFNPITNVFFLVHAFYNEGCTGKLVEYSPGMLYGVGNLGGLFTKGQIFNFNINTYTRLYSFNTTNGARPFGPLCIGTSGLLYGTTTEGGLNNCGTIYSFNPSGNQFTVLHHFNGILNVRSSLCEAAPRIFYGSAETIVGINDGLVFRFNASSALFTPIDTLNILIYASNVKNGFIKHPNNRLYGYRSNSYYSYPAADGNFYGICTKKSYFSIKYIYRLNPITFLFDTLLRYDLNSVIGQSASGDISFNHARTKFSGMSSRTGATNVGNLFVYEIIGDSLTFSINLTATIISYYFFQSHHLINDSIIIEISKDPSFIL